ncbi:hypothetical protein [Actinoplanes sp. G11-F43]|uniref:hypothetical protein n=1 Tax=Actinoplanes sp. G11-F43 TaxID=3424130 RepID=UPI003D345AC6
MPAFFDGLDMAEPVHRLRPDSAAGGDVDMFGAVALAFLDGLDMAEPVHEWRPDGAADGDVDMFGAVARRL